MTDLLTTCPGRGPETALKEGRERIGLEMTSLIQLNYFFVKKRIYFGAIGRLKLFPGCQHFSLQSGRRAGRK